MKIKQIFNKMGECNKHILSETLNIMPPALLLTLGIINPDTDNRRTVPITDTASSSIGQLRIGTYGCTSELIAPNVLLTAAHCVKKVKNSAINFYSLVTFSATTVNEQGHIINFTSQAVDICIPQEYREYSKGNVSVEYDFALVRLAHSAPEIFTPYTLPEFTITGRQIVDVYGYSHDMPGKSVEENCTAHNNSASPNYFTSNCTMNRGASGGPIIDQKGRVIGINSTIITNTKTGQISYLHAPVSLENLPTNWINPQNMFDVYKVTASNLNVREYPDTNGYTLGSIPTGTCVIIDSNEENGWKQVRLDPSESPTNMFLSDGSAYGSQYIEYVAEMTGQEMLRNCPTPPKL